ncbi:MAG: choice-of-anchor F family protein [Halioglobus sp.]
MTKMNKRVVLANSHMPSFKQTALVFAVAAVSCSAQAGKIYTIDGDDGDGFGGWNLDNVNIVLNPPAEPTFDDCCGTYSNPTGQSFSYYGEVTDIVNGGSVMGLVLAKDWPVGEPPGLKVIHNDQGVKPPKPQNCIMSTSYMDEHFLDSDDPQQVTCSGPFQSHKRYKLAMLPTTVPGDAGSEKGIDVVFNVVAEEGTRDYQVFQKINNWTDQRLAGFTIEVGVGVGETFVLAGDSEGVGKANLSLSVPDTVWSGQEKLANFSTGLFGPADGKHDRPPGYFDRETRAGFKILEYPANDSGVHDTLHSNGPLGSDYADVPAGAGGPPGNQFGSWLPNNMLPQGIFYDDDGNPATDAQLVGWYGYKPAVGLTWMEGAATEFAVIEPSEIEAWGSNLTYTMGDIDDLVNVGLNYIVTIGDVSNFPGFDTSNATFTIRIKPKVASNQDIPAYVYNTPEPILTFPSPTGVVTISPEEEFEIGSLLTARVGDANANAIPSDLGDEIVVNIQIDDNPPQQLTLIEQGESRGVYAASLPDAFSNVELGDVVTVTYTDDNVGDGTPAVVTASTTAIAVAVPPPPFVEIDIIDFSAPESISDGKSEVLRVTIESNEESELRVSGLVIVEGSDGSYFESAFNGLNAGKSKKKSFPWRAELADPEISEVVSWTASVVFDEGTDKYLTGVTSIEVKVKGKDR